MVRPLLPAQLRSGITYKISAGDAETLGASDSHSRGRPCTECSRSSIEHRPFRKPKNTISVFPDDKGSRPIVLGPIGSDVELTVHSSRPVKTASIEITNKAGKKELPIRMSQNDPSAFACRFLLDQPGQFRVTFTTPDGEENADRDAYPILVTDDDAPKVVLTQPGADVTLPENGTLTLIGSATSAIGVKGLTLHLRIIDGPDQSIALLPQPFRPGVSFQLPDGSYPLEMAYQDFVALDQFKDDKGMPLLLRPGNVIEYWLEATDAADYPNAAGNFGRSLPYKITLRAKPQDSAREKAKRDQAMKEKKKFEQQQDQDRAKKEPDPKGGNSGSANSQKSLDQIQKEQKHANKKLNNAKKEQQQNQERGEGKGAEQQNSEKKEGPQNPGDAPQPKPAPMSPPDDAGDKKDQGKGQGNNGESRDDGSPQKKKDNSPKGDKKDGRRKGPRRGSSKMGPICPTRISKPPPIRCRRLTEKPRRAR